MRNKLPEVEGIHAPMPHTRNPPLPVRNNIVVIQHTVTVHSPVIDIGRYFLNLFYSRFVHCCTNNK